MNFIELFINDPINATLDMDQNFDVAIQYSIADIRNVSKRNAAYSKTVVLPGTKNNNFWFGNLFDVNADFTAFNPNVKYVFGSNKISNPRPMPPRTYCSNFVFGFHPA